MKKLITSCLVLIVLLVNNTTAQTWGNVGGATGFNDAIRCFYADDATGTLYAAGSFTTTPGGAANRIAKWNGTSWSAMGNGFADGYVLAITKYNNEIYAGGAFTLTGSTAVTGIAKWNGTAWVALSTLR